MKAALALVTFALSSSVLFSQANPGWLIANTGSRSASLAAPADVWKTVAPTGGNTESTGSSSMHSGSFSPMLEDDDEDVGNDADAITPVIAELAQELRYDPVQIYNFCSNNIQYEHYWGSKKGATLTYLEGSGNAFDICSLMIALLRESGYSASYHYGMIELTDDQMAYWLQLPVYGSATPFGDIPNNGDFLASSYAADAYALGAAEDNTAYDLRYIANRVEFYLARGYPFIYNPDGYGLYWYIPHVWVQVVVDDTTYELDPSYKVYNPDVSPANLSTATGYNRTSLLSAAGGTTGTGWVENITTGNLSTALTGLSGNLAIWLKANNRPNDSVAQILGQQPLLPYWAGNLDDAQYASEPYFFDTDLIPLTTWSAIPDQWMATVTIQFGNGNYTSGNFATTYYSQTMNLAGLAGQKLSLWFSGNTANFYEDESELASFTLTNSTMKMAISVNQPFGYYTGNDTFEDDPSGYGDTPAVITTYAKGDTYAYAIPYGYEPNGRLTRLRQDVLSGYLNSGLTDTDWKVRTEMLNVIGLTFMDETVLNDALVNSQFGVIPLYFQRFGRVAQEGGYYVDMFLNNADPESADTDYTDRLNSVHVQDLFNSALEYGVLEQLQGGSNQAVSSIKILELANGPTSKIYRADSGNWTTGANIKSILHTNGYSNTTLDALDSQISGQHGVLLAPASPNITLDNWTGYGFAFAYDHGDVMQIQGGYDGGYSSTNDTVDSGPLIIYSTTDSAHELDVPVGGQNAPSSTFTSNITSIEPVDMASGAYTYDKTDLSVGGSAPRGLAFARNYNSARHADNSAGLGYGWTDNYDIFIAKRSNMLAGLGGTTPYQAAPYLAAIVAAKDMFVGNSNATEYETACLAAKWAVDQLSYHSLSITMGDKTVEYTALPDGTYAPPPGVTATLALSGGNYSLSERHGNTYNFSPINSTTHLGPIANITDNYAKALTFAYDGNTGLLTTVTDCYSRNLTLTWSNGTLANVTDSTGRHVDYAYTNGDLTSVTDAGNNTWAFSYDDDHDIIQLKDPASHTLVDNDYDDYHRVYEQDSQGNVSKAWKFFYSGFENTQEDPSGNFTTYYYDDRARLISIVDPVGDYDYRYYDGQDHVIAYFDPGNYETDYYYDQDQNLTGVTNALGHNTTNTYDSSDNLTATTDYRGNTTSYTYNAEFQLLTVHDDTANITTLTNTYNGTTGDVENITDAANNTIHYTTNSLGQVTGVTYPGNISENFTYNDLGDMLSHTDARGNVTSQTYNALRQPLVTTLPGGANLTKAYDSAGNLQSVTLPGSGNHTTSYTYSPSQKLLTTTFPTVDAGTANVTNHYDTRDWLASTTDPLGHNVTYTYDADQRLVATADQLDDTVSQTYDALGRVNTTTDAMNATTGFAYDALGEQTTLTDALTHNVTYTYDDNGNRLTLVNRRGKTFNFSYDEANRPLTVKTPLNYSTNTTYNALGLVQNIARPSGNTTNFTYDNRDRVASSNDTVGNISFGYDNNGNLLTVAQGGANLTRTYDARNRVISYTDAANNTIGYGYDDNNNLTSITYPGNHTVTYAYDGRNELTSVTDWSNRTTSYTYDLGGRVTGITWPNGASRSLTYDNAGRVTGIADWRAGSKRLALYSFGYDADGRVTDLFAAPIPQAHSEANITATFDNDNRLSAFGNLTPSYDDDGNMLTGPLLDAGTPANYTYNARNQLVSAGNVTTNGYDALGNRISLTVTGNATTTYVVNPNAALSQVLIRTKPDSSKTYYVYGAGGVLLYEVSGVGGTEDYKTYHYDQHGNTAFLLASDGDTITDHVEYSPFGTTTYRTGTTDTPFLYCGAFGVMTDPNGLLYMRARFYNPLMHTFVNADPIGFAGGLNWYAYANGDPINAMDPLGLWSWTQTFGVLRAVGGIFETAAGVGLGAATSWSGIGAVAGGGVALHGIDQVQAGLRQAFSGNETDSLTSSALQTAGVSRKTANLVDTGISVVGSLGAGTATASIRVSQIAANEPTLAEGLSQIQLLNRWEQGSQALSDADYAALGGEDTSALAKSYMMDANVDAGLQSYTITPLSTLGSVAKSSALFLKGSGLTPFGYLGSGILGSAGGLLYGFGASNK